VVTNVYNSFWMLLSGTIICGFLSENLLVYVGLWVGGLCFRLDF
jgi:hypothetical protein